MIEAKIDNAIAGALRAKSINLLEALRLKMSALLIALQAHIVTKHLSAPKGYSATELHHRSGHLIGSIRVIDPEMSGTTLIGAVEGGGGIAPYAAIHEYGGTFSIPEHTRRMGYNAKGSIIKLLTRGGMVRKQVASTREVVVRAHTATFPERSFMRSSLNEMHDQILDELRNTIRESLQ